VTHPLLDLGALVKKEQGACDFCMRYLWVFVREAQARKREGRQAGRQAGKAKQKQALG